MKRILFLALLILLLIPAIAQQDQLAEYINDQAHDTALTLQERMYVHADKSQYLAGEIAWFKVYLVDAINRGPAIMSKVAYVEIIDNSNNPVIRGKIALDKGAGAGSFVIPVGIKTGNYILRAYTSWMKNFSSDHFFQQPLTIFNTLQKYIPEENTNVRNINMDFFPESGSLVSNIKSVVAYRCTDAFGKGLRCSGVVLNHSNDTIQKFSSPTMGLGQFELTPLSGENYKAILKTDSGSSTVLLPSIEENGYSLHVNWKGDEINIDVSSTSRSDKKALLLIHQSGKNIFSRNINFSQPGSTLTVLRKELNAGVNIITLFNDEGIAVAERLLFKMPAQRLHLQAKTSDKTYGLREKVEVSVTANSTANLSASVYQLAPGATMNADIFTSLWLGSELHGMNEDLSNYLNNSTDSLSILDNLMLTFGYRKLNGQNGIRKPLIKYLPEFEGQIVEGTITNIQTGKPAPKIMTFLTIPGPTPGFYTSESDSDGRIRFVITGYYGNAEMIVQTDFRKDSIYKIEIRSPFITSTKRRVNDFDYDRNMEAWLAKAALAVQVNNHFNAGPLRTFYLQPSDSLLFYKKPFDAYNLDEYKRFTTMEEVLREYVPGVAVRRRNGKLVIDVVNQALKTLFEDPLLLIDGMPVFNSEQLLKYDPLKIRKLEVVNSRYVYGSSLFDGIASWQTYQGDLDGFAPDPRAIVIDYEGLQLQRQYYSPVYKTNEQKNSRIPDYRTSLCWSPYLITPANTATNFSFYTSDQAGTYVVVIQGMDELGNAGSSTMSFEVR